MTRDRAAVSDASLRLGYEPERTSAAAFAFGALFFLLVLVAIGLFASWLMLAYYNNTQSYIPGLASAHPAIAAGPGVLDDIASIRLRLEKSQLEALSQSGWVDRDAGVARIPLASAMHHIAQHGLPHFAAASQPATTLPEPGKEAPQ